MASRARRPVSITLGLCIAGGLAAGVALARPASDSGSDGVEAAPGVEIVTDDDGPAYGYPSIGGDADDAPTSPPADEAVSAAITIADFAFGPTLTVAPGTEVVVTNADGAPHSVSADDGSFDSGVLGQGESATFVAPSEPGTYTFFCVVHPSMQAELIVG